MTSPGTGTDWDALRERLARARLGLERSLRTPPGRIAQIMRQRAQRLAEELDDDTVAGDLVTVLSFKLAHETYALPLAALARVVQRVVPTPLPGAPPELRGAINLDGAVCAVAGLRELLSLPAAGTHGADAILILRGRGRVAGLAVDGVDTIVSVPRATLRPPDAHAGLLPARYVSAYCPGSFTLLNACALSGHAMFSQE